MKLSLILIFQMTSLLSPSILLANNIVSDGDRLKITASPTHSASRNIEDLSSKIKICSQDDKSEICSEFPKISSSIFRGTIKDWGYFFNRCNNFDHINTLYEITMAVNTLTLMPALGFWKTIAAEIAVGYVGFPPYPSEVKQVAIMKSEKMVLYMLKNKNKQIRVHSKYLIALQNILNVCSTLFDQDYIDRLASECLQGCHGQKSNMRYQRSQFAPLPQPDSHRRLNDPTQTLKPQSREKFRQEIMDYLESLESTGRVKSNESEHPKPNEIEQGLVY